MPISKEEVTKFIPVDLPDVLNDSEKKELQEIIGEYLVSEILQYVSTGKSPVKGEGAYSKLNKKYADKEKNGDRQANLDLNGDMLNSLTFEFSNDGVTVGVFDSEQAIKLFNHNTGDTLPKRQVIPDEKEDFKSEIITGIDRIIEDFINEKN